MTCTVIKLFHPQFSVEVKYLLIAHSSRPRFRSQLYSTITTAATVIITAVATTTTIHIHSVVLVSGFF